jgi:hypothetical protein
MAQVLHYYLEDAQVACVLISNNPLDAAKMNRTVCVRRPAPNLIECQALLADAMGYPSSSQPDVAALCAAYCSLMASGEALVPGGTVRFRDRFGLRDLYAFGRWFKRTGRSLPPSGADLLQALERNFGGVTPAEGDAIMARLSCELPSSLAQWLQPHQRRTVGSVFKVCANLDGSVLWNELSCMVL